MGNWTRIQIIGTANEGDAQKLNEWLSKGFESPEWDCLHNGGAAGLPNWGQAEINVVGNLGERGYDVNDIRDQLIKATAFAPSLDAKVHVGGEYESDECVNTITVKDGRVTIDDPEIESVPELDDAAIKNNIMRQLGLA